MKREVGHSSLVNSHSQHNRFFTISNLLSISRAVLAIPFALVMLSNSPNTTLWGIVILALAALTDKFDGVLARKLNEVTEWGKILDPVCDKIGMGVVAIVLVKLNLIPLWFVVAMVGRDLLILAGGIYVKKTKGVVLQSNQLGKWTIGVLALAMFAALCHSERSEESLPWLHLSSSVVDALIWLTVTMLAWSFALYVARFIEVIKLKAS